MTEITGEELFAWLIFKGNKFPLNKNKYRIKEGDIIKLGRLWLIVRVIHIPLRIKKEKRLEVKDTDCIQVSYHNQGNHSLNLKDDFKEDYKTFINDKLLENSDDESDSDSEKKDKNKINLIDDIKEKEKEKEKEKKLIKKNNSQKICRICYLEEENPILNPLIRPCKCSGSMKYIHLKCLVVWIKTKVEIDNSEYLDNGKYMIYSSEKVECELCKEVFPNYVRHNNKLYNIMDLEQNFGDEENNDNNTINITSSENNNNNNNKTNKSNKKKKEESGMKINYKKDAYIVLDSIPLEKNGASYRYISKFSNNLLKIGRGIDMDLIMNDLSISRNHCLLELNENGEILLTDSNSKFGTLILVQAKKMEILENQTLTIQVGRTFFNIGYKKNNSIFNCCHAEEIDLTKSYEKINYKAVKFTKYCKILTENDIDNDNDNDNEEVQIQIQKEEPKKETEYEKALKENNNNKISNKNKKERLKTYEEKNNNRELIDTNTKIENNENNKTFQLEKGNTNL